MKALRKTIPILFTCLAAVCFGFAGLARGQSADELRAAAFADQAETAWRATDYRLAYAHAQDALDLDANNVSANLVAARFAILEMLGPQEWGTTLEKAEGDIHGYVETRMDEAVERLLRVLVIDAGHVPARLLLGLVYYENEMFQRLVGLFDDYRRQAPEASEPYFMLALALVAQGEDAHARIAFSHGLSRLTLDDPYHAAGFVPDGTGAAARDTSVERAWASRDPLLSTPTNERLMEHYQRVAYANLRFSEDAAMRGGWKSDRGTVYIRYGAPIERFISASSVGPDQLWSYDPFSVSFMRLRGRPWTYRNGIFERKEYRSIEALAKAYPPVYRVDTEWTTFPLDARFVQFRGPEGRTRVDVDVTLRDSRIGSEPGPRGARQVDVEHGVLALDDAWQVRERSLNELRYLTWLAGDREGGYFVRSDVLNLAPGTHPIRVELVDIATDALGLLTDTLVVRAFTGDALALSDIAVNRRSVTREDGRGRTATVFLPAPNGIGVRGRSLEAFAEVYNLAIHTAPDTARFSAQFAVRPAEDPDGWTLVSSTTEATTDTWAVLRLKLDLTETAPGPKRLRLRLTDHARNETVERVTDFRVVW